MNPTVLVTANKEEGNNSHTKAAGLITRLHQRQEENKMIQGVV